MAPPQYVYLINNITGCKRRCLNPAWVYYMQNN